MNSNAKLRILDRLLLLAALPNEGNLLEIRTLMKLKEKLYLTEEEVREHKITYGNGIYNWPEKAHKYQVEMEVSLAEIDIIKKSLKKLNEEHKLTEKHLNLCDLFGLE